jgi:hypothetical protein
MSYFAIYYLSITIFDLLIVTFFGVPATAVIGAWRLTVPVPPSLSPSCHIVSYTFQNS